MTIKYWLVQCFAFNPHLYKYTNTYVTIGDINVPDNPDRQFPSENKVRGGSKLTPSLSRDIYIYIFIVDIKNLIKIKP